MDKIIKLIILILFLYTSEYSFSQDSNLIENNLKGKVKSVTSQPFTAIDKFGVISKGSDMIDNEYVSSMNNFGSKTKSKYNVNGDITEKNFFFRKMIISKFVYEYNSNNKLSVLNQYNQEGNIIKKEIYKYSSNGTMSEKKLISYQDNKQKEFFYQYDKFNKRIEMSIFNLNTGTIEGYSYEYELDDKGKVILENKFFIASEHVKDNPKVILERKSFKKSSVNIAKFKLKFIINQENKTKKFISRKYEDILTELNTHNDPVKFDVKSYTDLSKDDLKNMNIDKEELNSQGYEIMCKVTENNKTFKYKYDKYNNWIERIMYEDYIPRVIVERKIDYY